MLDRLWIGSTEDFTAPLRALGFTGVLDLRDGHHAILENVATHRVTNRDGDPWDKEQVLDALDFVSDHLRHGRVLVACAAGMSRSVCMVIGHLVAAGMDVASAFELVRAARPIATPVPKMLNAVLEAVRS